MSFELVDPEEGFSGGKPLQEATLLAGKVTLDNVQVRPIANAGEFSPSQAMAENLATMLGALPTRRLGKAVMVRDKSDKKGDILIGASQQAADCLENYSSYQTIAAKIRSADRRSNELVAECARSLYEAIAGNPRNSQEIRPEDFQRVLCEAIGALGVVDCITLANNPSLGIPMSIFTVAGATYSRLRARSKKEKASNVRYELLKGKTDFESQAVRLKPGFINFDPGGTAKALQNIDPEYRDKLGFRGVLFRDIHRHQGVQPQPTQPKASRVYDSYKYKYTHSHTAYSSKYTNNYLLEFDNQVVETYSFAGRVYGGQASPARILVSLLEHDANPDELWTGCLREVAKSISVMQQELRGDEKRLAWREQNGPDPEAIKRENQLIKSSKDKIAGVVLSTIAYCDNRYVEQRAQREAASNQVKIDELKAGFIYFNDKDREQTYWPSLTIFNDVLSSVAENLKTRETINTATLTDIMKFYGDNREKISVKGLAKEVYAEMLAKFADYDVYFPPQEEIERRILSCEILDIEVKYMPGFSKTWNNKPKEAKPETSAAEA